MAHLRPREPAAAADMLRLMHLYAIAPGYVLKPANSVPTPIGPADHQQPTAPTARTTASHRFQQRSSQSKARRSANLPTRLSRPSGLDPAAALSRCATPARQQAMPCRVPRYSPEILQKKLQQENCYVWMQQCLRGAWRVCPNIHTTHGTSFVPQLRNVLRAVFKSAFTDVIRSVFGSTTNRATGACRVKDGYKRISCLAISPSGKASRHLGTTPRAPGRYSVTFCMPGTTGTSSPAPNRTVSSAHRLRHWLDARYVDGDDGR